MGLFGMLYPKAKSDALTELFHRYLEFLYLNYIQQIRNKLWMREGDLDESLVDPYQNQTLRDILCGYRTVPQGLPNTFIFQGEKGDGRRFFIKKVIETCYESIQHIGWEQAKDTKNSFRFPIYISKNITLEKMPVGQRMDLKELASQCVAHQLNLIKNKEKQLARELVDTLGSLGKLAVLFEEDICENYCFLDWLDISAETTFQSIAIFTEMPKFQPKNADNCCCVRMKELTERQIVKYLTTELPEMYEAKETEKKFREQREVAALLYKPEWLQLHVRVVRENPEFRTATAIHQIYDTFLSARIDQAYENRTDLELTKKDLEDWLIQHAKKEECSDPQWAERCCDCLANTGIFRKDSVDFRFEDCKYYLIAKSYVSNDMKTKDIQRRLQRILKEENLAVLKFFADIYIAQAVQVKRQNLMFKQLVRQIDTPEVREKYREPAGLLADVMAFTNRVDKDGPEFVSWACKEMEKDTYDTSVLETLSTLNRNNPNAGITAQLTNQYKTTNNARVKRRIAYCFGYMGQRYFPDELIADLCSVISPPSEQEQSHLQYHISAALADNCMEKEDIEDHFPELETALCLHTDPILRSDFDTLYTRLNGSSFLCREDESRCEDELIHTLEHGSYWQKAHAAGALGRRSYEGLGIGSVVTKLIQALDNTLTAISRSQDEGHTELKTVSYIVEACCQIAVKNNYNDKVEKQFRNILEKYLIELPNSGITIAAYKHFRVALKLLGTGLKYLLNKEGSIRKELGLCFSFEDNFLQTLSGWFQWERGPEWQDLRAAIKGLEEWSTPQGAEKELRCIFPEKQVVSAKLEFSLTYLWYEDNPVMVGFLFLFQNDIYFITCRHCFLNSSQTLRQSPEQASFSPACQNSNRRYHGVLCYPESLDKLASSDETASSDIVFYRLIDIPACFAQVVFSSKDLPNGEILNEDLLEAFSFPRTSLVPGRWFQCNGYKGLAHGFFTMHTEEKFTDVDTNLFSGAPIIKSPDIILGMWRGSNAQRGNIEGISIQSILGELSKILKDGGMSHE